MASERINLLVDRELLAALATHAQQRGINLSAAVRDLLRHALGIVSSPQDAGWREGYVAGFQAMQQATLDAAAATSPVLPVDLFRKNNGP